MAVGQRHQGPQGVKPSFAPVALDWGRAMCTGFAAREASSNPDTCDLGRCVTRPWGAPVFSSSIKRSLLAEQLAQNRPWVASPPALGLSSPRPSTAFHSLLTSVLLHGAAGCQALGGTGDVVMIQTDTASLFRDHPDIELEVQGW